MRTKPRLKTKDGRLKTEAPVSPFSVFSLQSSDFSVLSSRSAFSLIEMMIAIVILGLGLVMVATMFPVAWDRARTLSEHTTEQTIASAAHARMEATLRPAGIKLIPNPSPIQPPYEIATIGGGSFAGDLLFDQTLSRGLLSIPTAAQVAFQGIIPSYCDGPLMFYSDTRVHVLNMENLTAADFVETAEDPWELERISDIIGDGHPCAPGPSGWPLNLSDDFLNRSFSVPRSESRIAFILRWGIALTMRRATPRPATRGTTGFSTASIPSPCCIDSGNLSARWPRRA